jgi:hypothetical protein
MVDMVSYIESKLDDLSKINKDDEILVKQNKVLIEKLNKTNEILIEQKDKTNEILAEQQNKTNEILNYQKDNAKIKIAYYSMACYCSLHKDKSNALKYLRKAVGKGYDNLIHIQKDLDFKYINKSKEFKEILKIIEENSYNL